MHIYEHFSLNPNKENVGAVGRAFTDKMPVMVHKISLKALCFDS